jgi:hypothetical protein
MGAQPHYIIPHWCEKHETSRSRGSVVGTLVTVGVDWIGIVLVDWDADGRKVSLISVRIGLGFVCMVELI